MSVSLHVYTAQLIGTPDVPLSVRGGSVTLDEARAPHVQGTIDIALPALSTLAALDPRLAPRIRIVATGRVIPSGVTVSRTFDLSLRSRQPSISAATLSLGLASDETLAADYAPLADDPAAFSRQSSIRAVVNYVLGKALPGAALEASPAIDADVSALADATNLSPNGGLRASVQGWTGGASIDRFAGGPPGVGVTWFGRVTFSAAVNTGGVFNIGGEQPGITAVNVTSQAWYRTAQWVRTSVAATVSLNIEWVNDTGAFLSAVLGPTVALTANTWTRLELIAQAPVGAARAGSYVYRTAGTWPNGSNLDFAAHRFSDRPGSMYDLFEFFDHATTDTDAYGYAAVGAINASPSTRTNLVGRSPDLLLWKAGVDAISFLAPLVQYAGMRLVCDEQRCWTLRGTDYIAPGSLARRAGVNLIEGSDTIDRDAGVWFDAAVTRYRWINELGERQEAVDAFALTTPHKRLVVFDRETPYPGPGFSEYAVRRAQGRGREVTATVVSDWTALVEQPAIVTLDGAPVQTGRTARLVYDLNRDEMTITTRTTDTIVGAIDLVPGTINSLSGTINSL